MEAALCALKVALLVLVQMYVELVWMDMKKKADTGVSKLTMMKLNVFS